MTSGNGGATTIHMNEHAPWLLRSEIGTLFTLPPDGPGRVLMTHPGTPPSAAPGNRPLPIGAALGAALLGRTEDFAMVVGYFGHGGQSARLAAAHDLHDPVALLLGELAETRDRDDEARARFHLLFGGIASRASALALELWWWSCRWRVSCPSAADAWRARVLADLPSERGPLLARVHSLFVPEHTLSLPLLAPHHPSTLALLEHLMRHPGTVHSRGDLLDHVWDANYDGLSNVVDVHIANLRRKLDVPGDPAPIETVRGLGYQLRA